MKNQTILKHGKNLLLVLSVLASSSAVAKTTAESVANSTKTAIFAGGCFWCTESDFEKVDGVIEAISGYTAGKEKNPTYRQVSSGRTGHTEAVKVIYDPKKVSYQQLLDVYWPSIDPTVKDRQFCDVGSQYRTGIYYQNADQKNAAEASLKALENSNQFKKIHTEIKAFDTFYEAEDYHQDYYKINPIRYNYYRYSCGRDKRLETLWGKAVFTLVVE